MELKVREWRRFKGWTQEDLAAKSGLDRVTISGIERKGRAGVRAVQYLSQAFGIPAEKLYTSPTSDATQTASLPADVIARLLPDASPVVPVPVVNRIPASPFGEAFDETAVEEWTVSTLTGKPGIFALRARGDSMAPRIENGDLVICSPNEEFVNEKIYAVVTTDSEHTLKLVRKVGSEYFCMPLNPAFGPLVLHESQVLRLVRVLEILKRA